jgi:hypothetical protein
MQYLTLVMVLKNYLPVKGPQLVKYLLLLVRYGLQPVKDLLPVS